MRLKDGKMILCFIDTETGGTEPEDSCIIGIGAMRIEVDIKEKILRSSMQLNLKVKPTCPVDPGAARVNGYNATDWSLAVTIEDALNQLYPFISGAVIAGWNADFDLRFVKKAWRDFKWQWPYGTPYKTFEVSTHCVDLLLTGKLEYIHLKTVGAHYGFIPEGENPHDGLLDILLTIKIFEKYLFDKGIIEKSEIDYNPLDEWVMQCKEKKVSKVLSS